MRNSFDDLVTHMCCISIPHSVHSVTTIWSRWAIVVFNALTSSRNYHFHTCSNNTKPNCLRVHSQGIRSQQQNWLISVQAIQLRCCDCLCEHLHLLLFLFKTTLHRCNYKCKCENRPSMQISAYFTRYSREIWMSSDYCQSSVHK